MPARARTAPRPPAGPTIGVAWPQPDYLTALRRAGASPRVLTAAADPAPGALDGCAGLLLTGGADVDPEFYGETERHPTVSPEPGRDEYEIVLTRAALARDLPILAICRGVQLLNVAAGGTLVQDIPTQLDTTLMHKRVPRRRKSERVHPVTVAPGTCLARLLAPRLDARRQVEVNSRHHQAVRTVAPGFVVAASAPDGIVEAIERPAATFCLGVQWHPENFWRTGEFAELFTALVDAARRRTGKT
jgi:putative glutamine amidotransferase